MGIINIIGFEDIRMDINNYGEFGTGLLVYPFTFFPYTESSGYKHLYLNSTGARNLGLLSKNLTRYGVPRLNDGSYIYDKDILSLSFNVNPTSGNTARLKLSFPNHDIFQLTSLHNNYSILDKNNKTVFNGVIPQSGINSVNLFYQFSSNKLRCKINGDVVYRGYHNFTLNDLLTSQTQSDFYVNISGAMPLSDVVISDYEDFNNHKVLFLKPIATDSGNSYSDQGRNANNFLTHISPSVAFDNIKLFNNTYKTTGNTSPAYSGVYVWKDGFYSNLGTVPGPGWYTNKIFTPSSEISGKQISSLKTFFRLGNNYSTLDTQFTGVIRQSGLFDFGHSENFGLVTNFNPSVTDPVTGVVDTYTSTFVKNFNYNPITNTSWVENDISNIGIGVSGTCRLLYTGAFILLNSSTASSGDDFNNVNFFCKTQELQSSGNLNFFLKGQDCVTTLRPSGDATVQHPLQWSNLPVWSNVDEDPDFIGDDTTSTVFSQSGNYTNNEYLYYTGDGVRRIHLASGTNSELYPKNDSFNYQSRLLFNSARNNLVFGYGLDSTKYASISDQQNDETVADEFSLVDWKTSNTFMYSASSINRKTYNSDGTLAISSQSNLSLSFGESIVYHDLDYRNREGYYVTSAGRLFRQNLNTFSVSGIGTTSASLRPTYNSPQQIAAFDFDNKRIFFVPSNNFGQLGIAQTTFSGTIPAYTFIKAKSTNPTQSSYFDEYKAVVYNNEDKKIYYSKVNAQYLAESGFQTAGIYSIYPGGSGESTILEVQDQTGSSGIAYGLAFDGPQYRSSIEFNLTDIPNDVLKNTLQQFTNVSVKLTGREKYTAAYITPKILSSGGDILWRTTRNQVGFFPASGQYTQNIGVLNSKIAIGNNRPNQWQDAVLKLDINYPDIFPSASGEFEFKAVEVRAACSGIFESAPSRTGIFPLYVDGIGRSRESINLHTLAGTAQAACDMFLAGHIKTSGAVDFFIRYQKISSGIDFITKGITRHSGIMNMSLATKEVKTDNDRVDFFTVGTNDSGLFNNFNMFIGYQSSGEIYTSMNMSISGYKTYAQDASLNMSLYSPIPKMSKVFDFSLINNSSSLSRKLNMFVKTKIGTAGLKPKSGEMNMFIGRDKESAASHVHFNITGPQNSTGIINFNTIGRNVGTSGIDFITLADKETFTNNVNFYSHGF